MKKIITIILITLTLNVSAKFKQNIKVKYQTKYGWSTYYDVVAVFATGYELNKATESFDYDTFSTYCFIWWNEDQYTTIKLNFVSCGYEAQSSCISYYSSLNGKDQDGDKWFICLMRYCY